MPENGLKFTYTVVENNQVVYTEDIHYDGPRFFYKDYPQYSASFELFSEWSVLSGLANVILYHRPFPVVELGAGESTRILAQAAERFNVKFYSVDKKEHKKTKYGGNYEFYLGDIADFMKVFNDTPAIVLIDANHSYDVAKQEFEFFFDKLVEGGVIFLHDTYPSHERMLENIACSDVYRLRQDIEKMDRNLLDIFTWPYTAKWCGLSMVIKKEKDRPYWGL